MKTMKEAHKTARVTIMLAAFTCFQVQKGMGCALCISIINTVRGMRHKSVPETTAGTASYFSVSFLTLPNQTDIHGFQGTVSKETSIRQASHLLLELKEVKNRRHE